MIFSEIPVVKTNKTTKQYNGEKSSIHKAIYWLGTVTGSKDILSHLLPHKNTNAKMASIYPF